MHRRRSCPPPPAPLHVRTARSTTRTHIGRAAGRRIRGLHAISELHRSRIRGRRSVVVAGSEPQVTGSRASVSLLSLVVARSGAAALSLSLVVDGSEAVAPSSSLTMADSGAAAPSLEERGRRLPAHDREDRGAGGEERGGGLPMHERRGERGGLTTPGWREGR